MTAAGTAGREPIGRPPEPGDAPDTVRPAALTLVGDEDAGLCVDGVCALPSPAREAARPES